MLDCVYIIFNVTNPCVNFQSTRYLVFLKKTNLISIKNLSDLHHFLNAIILNGISLKWKNWIKAGHYYKNEKIECKAGYDCNFNIWCYFVIFSSYLFVIILVRMKNLMGHIRRTWWSQMKEVVLTYHQVKKFNPNIKAIKVAG